MATTLPTFSKTIDNAFVTTWYEIKEEAIDNILNATPVWAIFNNAGCFEAKEGGDLITETIRYGTVDATEVDPDAGDLLPMGETELETMAIWNWGLLASHVQRTLFDDQKNRGPDKIKDFVGMKLNAAKDGLEQKYEELLFRAFQTTSGKFFQGLNSMIPPSANRKTGSYGGIARPSAYIDMETGAAENPGVNGVEVGDPAGTNGWWGPKYLQGALATIDDDLFEDMKTLYNGITNNQSSPNLIITTRTIFSKFETFADNLVQIVKDESTMLANLGFEVLRFKGKPMIWSEEMTANELLMINTDFIKIKYDPGYWFDMTDWKPDGPRGTTRIAHIVCFAQMISNQLRRHGRLTYA